MERQRETNSAEPRRISMSAWLISAAIHLALLVLCVLFLRCDRPAISDEADRPVAIVIAQRQATQANYFSDESDDPLIGQRALVTAAVDAAADMASPADMPPPLIPGLELPHRTAGATSSQAPGGELSSLPLGSGPRGRPRIPGLIDEAAIRAIEAAIPREVAPTGPTASLSLFGAPQATGRSFVFVIDRSASMGPEGLGAIGAAAKELEASLSALTAEQTFQVVAYNQTSTYFTGRELIPATAQNQKKLAQFVANMAAYGETEHVRGLNAALRLKPEVIYLLTDGDPQINPLDLQTIRDQAANRTAIHCLQFGRGRPEPAEQQSFERLARENRGTYTYLDMNQR